MWDMLARTIHVLDLQADPEQKECHEYIAFRLHEAMFQCLNEFFAGWPIKKERFTTTYPKIVDTKFDR